LILDSLPTGHFLLILDSLAGVGPQALQEPHAIGHLCSGGAGGRVLRIDQAPAPVSSVHPVYHPAEPAPHAPHPAVLELRGVPAVLHDDAGSVEGESEPQLQADDHRGDPEEPVLPALHAGVRRPDPPAAGAVWQALQPARISLPSVPGGLALHRRPAARGPPAL